MNIAYIRFVIVTLLLIAVQVWVFGSLQLWEVMSLWFYPVLLSFLPIEQSRVSLVWIGFSIGMLIDALMLTPGLHASAMAFTSLMRYYCLLPMLDQNVNQALLPTYGLLKGGSIFLLGELLLIHHLILFGLDVGLHGDWEYLLQRLGASWAGAMLLATLVFLTLSIRLQPRTDQHGK